MVGEQRKSKMINRQVRAKKIANRLIKKSNLEVPVDIKDLIACYAEVEEDSLIPFDYDAICVFDSKKPSITYNATRPEKRIRFTLAHELGHILIPGHKNSIACNTDRDYRSIYDVPIQEMTEELEEYFSKEREADAFAAELLMPEFWLKEIIKEESTYEDIICRITSEAKLSYVAISIAIKKHLEPGMVIIAESSSNRLVTMSYGTNVSYDETLNGDNVRFLKSKAHKTEQFSLSPYNISVYYLYEEIALESVSVDLSRSSTDVIKECLGNYYNEDEVISKFRSINGIMGSLNGQHRVKDMTEDEYFAIVDRKFRSREAFSEILDKGCFNEYIYYRYMELKSR